MTSELRVAFAGTPEFAAQALAAIIDAGFTVPLVLTQPDRPAGRGMKSAASAVKQLAATRGIAVDQPEKLRTEAQHAALAASRADVLVVAAYGLILPPAVLAMPRFGCINIHASLLPRWRGAAPIHRAIEAGDSETGITIMQMDEGLDTGPMLLCERLPILPDDTTGSLHDRLARLGAVSIVKILTLLAEGGGTRLAAQLQPEEGVTYAQKISRSESVIDWKRPAVDIQRMIRAFNPFPGAVATLRDTPVKVWAVSVLDETGKPGTILDIRKEGIVVACGQRALCLEQLQRPGSRRLMAGEFLRGFEVCAGESFIF